MLAQTDGYVEREAVAPILQTNGHRDLALGSSAGLARSTAVSISDCKDSSSLGDAEL